MTTDFKTFVPARTALTGANTAPDDVLPIIDVSASETKKITREEFQTYNAGTLTTDKKILDLSATWNNAAVTFTGLKFNVTDTASNASSLLLDLQVGGSTKLKVGKNAQLQLANLTGRNWAEIASGGVGSAIRFNTQNIADRGSHYFDYTGIINVVSAASAFIGFSSSTTDATNANGDTKLCRDAAGIFAQRNGTNAQTFRLYNTYTDASNYERLAIGWAANVVSIKPENAGTGAARVLHISGLPTSNPGPGILWNNAGTPAIGT